MVCLGFGEIKYSLYLPASNPDGPKDIMLKMFYVAGELGRPNWEHLATRCLLNHCALARVFNSVGYIRYMGESNFVDPSAGTLTGSDC